MDFEKASKTQQEYRDGLAYKKQMGFMTRWPEYERFKAGDQWPPPTERTKDLPRPVFNIIEQIQAHKVASVMNENIKLVFSPEEVLHDDQDKSLFEIASEAAERYTQMAEATWERIQQDELNEEALESGSNIGGGFYHYYWDASYKGGTKLKFVGEMCGEMIDPMNIIFGNPQQKKVQKQPRIIIDSREEVDDVKELAQENGVAAEHLELITPNKNTEDQGYDMAKLEPSDSSKTTVITRYWKERKTGTIWFRKVCGTVVIQDDTDTHLKLYPIAALTWKRRKKSIHGIGDTEGLIPNQKAINLLMALQLLNAQLTGFPKLMVKKDYIKQQITNTIGEILNDTSQNGWGAQYLIPGQISAHVPDVTERYIEYTKRINGANEDALGERVTKELNATAIMLLQKAAGVSVESIKRRFYRAIEDIGRIWMEFFRVKYNTERMITVKDADGNDVSVPFNGEKYKDINLKLKIDIGPSSSYSETLMMSTLDKLFDGGHIDLEQYLTLAPKNVAPFKDRLLKDIQQRQQQQQQPAQPGGIEQILSHLPPHEQQAFKNAPPEIQQRIIEQLLQQPQQPTQPQQQMQPQPQGIG